MLSGLRVTDIQIGTGTVAVRGSRVTVRYSARLNRGDVVQADVVATFKVGERNTICRD